MVWLIDIHYFISLLEQWFLQILFNFFRFLVIWNYRRVVRTITIQQFFNLNYLNLW